MFRSRSYVQARQRAWVTVVRGSLPFLPPPCSERDDSSSSDCPGHALPAQVRAGQPSGSAALGARPKAACAASSADPPRASLAAPGTPVHRAPGTPRPSSAPAPLDPLPPAPGIPSTRAPWAAASSGRPRSRSRQFQPIRARGRGALPGPDGDLSDDEKEEALNAYERDKHALTAQGPRAAIIETWTRMLRLWHGMPTPILPVEPKDVAHVGALFKKYNYRSFANYLSRVKEMHIAAGYQWTPQHALEATHGVRSVTRGQGPPRQSAPLPVPEAHGLNLGLAPLVGGGMINPGAALVIGSCFMLREIELAYARARHLSFNHSRRVVTFELPLSKTDPCAIGCTRSWGCVCDEQAASLAAAMPCPYHIAKAHDEALRLYFGQEADEPWPPEMPLFPTPEGSTVFKEAVVLTIEEIARRLSLPIYGEAGDRLFGGHSFRVSGAKWLAAEGLPVEKIQSLARWSSSIVLRYIGEAHLADLAKNCRRLQREKLRDAKFLEGTDFDEPRLRDNGPVALLDLAVKEQADALVDLSARVGAIEEDAASASDRVAASDDLRTRLGAIAGRISAVEDPRFVMNIRSGTVHVISGSTTLPSITWRTRCGWCFGDSRGFKLLHDASRIAPSASCSKCNFPQGTPPLLIGNAASEVVPY